MARFYAGCSQPSSCPGLGPWSEPAPPWLGLRLPSEGSSVGKVTWAAAGPASAGSCSREAAATSLVHWAHGLALGLSQKRGGTNLLSTPKRLEMGNPVSSPPPAPANSPAGLPSSGPCPQCCQPVSGAMSCRSRGVSPRGGSTRPLSRSGRKRSCCRAAWLEGGGC